MPQKTVKAGLFGLPLSRSRSPEVFRALAELSGTDISYEPREVSAENLIAGIERARMDCWSGFNVTIPHKRAVLKMLSMADPSAEAAGAVNCVRFGKTGLEGTNTDALALKEIFSERGLPIQGARATVFGAGGAAAAAAWALAKARAAKVEFRARNLTGADRLAGRFRAIFPSTVFSSSLFTSPDTTEILINATPLGMYQTGMPPCRPKRGDICVDLAYAQGPTEFIAAADAAGAETVHGLEILVCQAILSFRHWSGLKVGDIVEFKRKALELIEKRR